MSDTGASAKQGLGRTVFLLVGIVCLAVAGWQAWRSAQFLRSAVQAQGVVAPDSPGSTRTVSAGHPAIVFRTGAGESIRYVQNGMSGARIGSAVRVLYSPSDPKGSAQAAGFFSLWGGAILPAVMGLGFLLLPLLGFEIGGRAGRF